MGSVSTANQSKKGLALLTSFSFMFVACLLTASNEALAMDLATFRSKYGQIEGYTEQPISKFQAYLETPEAQHHGSGSEYVLRPKLQGTNLYVPELVYNDFFKVKTIQLDPALTKEQIEQEIKKLQRNGLGIYLQ